ncbi:MAG TPA: DUF6496 domain-containing protein [Polyangiaceae bacterium]|nr:DUF6496 domain-containing protein [Polyangiaceae bacterium]
MPDPATKKRAAKDKREGKSVSTQAGEFVREEIHHIREGKHGARNTKQAIAIGLSKARRAGVALPPPDGPRATRRQAQHDLEASGHAPSPTRSRATRRALEHEGQKAASPSALAGQARQAASRRGPRARALSAQKAARTKGAAGRSRAAKKAAATRAHPS